METKLKNTKFSFNKMNYDISNIIDEKTVSMSMNFNSVVNDDEINVLIMNLDVELQLKESNLFDIRFVGRFVFDEDVNDKEKVKEFGKTHAEEMVYNDFKDKFEVITKSLSGAGNSIPLPTYHELIEFNKKRKKD